MNVKGRGFHVRGLTSFIVTLAFLVMIVSGAVLFAAPRGRDAAWFGWAFLRLHRDTWVGLHVLMGLLFVFVGLIHAVYNWRILWSYIHLHGSKMLYLWREAAIAVGLILAILASAIWLLPPLSAVLDWNQAARKHWASTTPRAPFAHAEEATLDDLARRAGLGAQDLISSLNKRGIIVQESSQTLSTIAERNDTSPAAVFAAMVQDYPGLSELRGGRGMGRGSGQGRGMGWGRGSGEGRGSGGPAE